MKASIKKQYSSKQGFSLVETVAYIGIVAVLFVVVLKASLSIASAYESIKLSKEMAISSTTFMDRLSREIQNAVSVDQANSILNSSPGQLSLNTYDSSGSPTTVKFYIKNGTLELAEAGADSGSLISDSISIGSLVFYSISSSNSKAVKVDLTLNGTLQSQTVSKTFSDTIILRNSYSN